MSKATIEWQPREQQKHKERARAIRRGYGDAAMVKYLEAIEHVELTLADNPRAGEACPTSKRPLLRKTTSSNDYSVFYTINNAENPTLVVIVAVGKGIETPS